MKYSVVVPFYNEESIAKKLCERIMRVMRHVGAPYELVVVNDGSRDGTARVLEDLAAAHEQVVFVDLRRNFGQATALQAGFDQAVGEIVIAMDGDLQHDPYEIPLFIKKIDEGWDIASGWRVRRGDGWLMRRLPSKIANWMLAKASGVRLHDFGTTYKAYRREVLEGVRLYGDMHRFVPAIAARLGARICEVPIKNVRRPSGRSNYGIGRTFRVALDIITLRFTSRYMTRPLHFFGKPALLSLLAGGATLLYLFLRKVIGWNTFDLMTEHGPLLMMGVVLFFMGLIFLTTGLMGEMLMRVYFEATSARTYSVRRVVRKEDGAKSERTL